MPIKSGRHFLSIPGPSVMPDRVLNAMHRGAPNIYEGALVDMMPALYADLRQVAGAMDARLAVYVANGHGAWEAAVSNTLSKGDRVLVLDCGRFAEGWGQTARAMGVEAEIVHTGDRGAVPPAELERRLREDTDHAYKAVLLVQVDTASSAVNDIPALRGAIDAAGHPALFMVDCIACLGSVPFEFDAWGVDVMVAASQKGLMTPPGVSFCFVSEKAWAHRGDLTTAYWDWRLRAEPEMFYQRFGGTAPTHHLYGLREALDMLVNEEGVETAWARHRWLAGAVRAAVEAWGRGGTEERGVEFNVSDPAARSDVVTTVLTRGFDPQALRRLCEEEMGVTLGTGLGRFAGSSFRIAHMGWLNPPMILGALGAVEAALARLDVPHGPGLTAAAQAIAAGLPTPATDSGPA